MPHPKLLVYRIPVPKPVEFTTIQDCMQGSFDPARAEPAYLVANYEFTGAAMVELDGTVKYVIYKYTGME